MNFPRKVYAIRHNKTNRVYVGSSSRVDNRFKEHMCALRNGRHSVEDMQADFEKYGEDYSFTVLDEIATYEDRLKEYDWMKKYRSYDKQFGYNYKDYAFRHTIKNETELLKMIRNHPNPATAMVVATVTIAQFLIAEAQKSAYLKG